MHVGCGVCGFWVMKGLSGLLRSLVGEKNLTSSKSHAKSLFYLPSDDELSYVLLSTHISGMGKQNWRWGHTKASACYTSSLSICFQPLEIIFPFPRYFSITGFGSHQKRHNFASSWSCVLNLKSSLQLNTTVTAAAVGIPSLHRGPCCWVEFPEMRSEWATESIGLWGTISTMTSPLKDCVLRGVSARCGL